MTEREERLQELRDNGCNVYTAALWGTSTNDGVEFILSVSDTNVWIQYVDFRDLITNYKAADTYTKLELFLDNLRLATGLPIFVNEKDIEENGKPIRKESLDWLLKHFSHVTLSDGVHVLKARETLRIEEILSSYLKKKKAHIIAYLCEIRNNQHKQSLEDTLDWILDAAMERSSKHKKKRNG